MIFVIFFILYKWRSLYLYLFNEMKEVKISNYTVEVEDFTDDVDSNILLSHFG